MRMTVPPARSQNPHPPVPRLSTLCLLAGALLAGAVLIGLPRPARAALTCGDETPLSLLAFDTASGRMLFSLLGAEGEVGLLEIAPGTEAASLFTQPRGQNHFAGSVGPGPLFALRRCGKSCVAVETFHEGGWSPMGAPLNAPDGANLYATYDRLGQPWVLAHRPSQDPDWVEAQAFRFDGDRWREAGSLPVHSLTSLGTAPAPQRDEAVISGSGLFVAGEEPRRWLEGVPALPEVRSGQAISLDGEAVIYLAPQGGLYLSPDRGKTWRRSRWTPWGVTRSDVWTYGKDYSLDLPLGTLGSPLPVAWFDRRTGEKSRIFLTELEPDGRWQLRAELDSEVEGPNGQPRELFHLLRTAGGTWLLLTDCITGGGPPHIVVRTVTLAGVAPVRTLPVLPRLATTEVGDS